MTRLVKKWFAAVGALVLSVACSLAELAGPIGSEGRFDASVPEDGGVALADGRTPVDGTAVTPPSTSAATVVVEPDEKANVVLDAIKAAKKSIHVTIYLLTAKSIRDALLAQKQNGLDVKVILNHNFPNEDFGDNTAEFAELEAAGVPVVWGPKRFVYTHAKTIVIDGESAWVMTMNLTFTSPTQNREFLVRVTDADDVSELEAIFEADFADKTDFVPGGKLVVAPDNARERLTALVDSATASIVVECQSFSDRSLVEHLVAAKARGVDVRIVVDEGSSSKEMTKALEETAKANIPVRRLASPKVHAKAIVVDGAIAYAGSVNLTYNSMNNNREVGVLVGTALEVKKIADVFETDFAAASAL